MTHARTFTLAVLGVALALSGCSPSTSTPTTPAPAQSTAAPSAEPTPTPEATTAWKAQPIRDGLLTVTGTRLLAPAETVTEGTASGWYAALEVEVGADADAVSAAFVKQLNEASMTVVAGTMEDATRTIAAEGLVEDRMVRYDILIAPGSADAVGTVTILVASTPVAAS